MLPPLRQSRAFSLLLHGWMQSVPERELHCVWTSGAVWILGLWMVDRKKSLTAAI